MDSAPNLTTADGRAIPTLPYLTWLQRECGYRHVQALSNNRWAAVMPLMYTAAIVVGRVGDLVGYDNRWCYHDEAAAQTALREWSGEGEPKGWHRHPASGRRVSPEGMEEIYL